MRRSAARRAARVQQTQKASTRRPRGDELRHGRRSRCGKGSRPASAKPHRDEQHREVGRGDGVAGGAHPLHIHRVPRVLPGGVVWHGEGLWARRPVWYGRELSARRLHRCALAGFLWGVGGQAWQAAQSPKPGQHDGGCCPPPRCAHLVQRDGLPASHCARTLCSMPAAQCAHLVAARRAARHPCVRTLCSEKARCSSSSSVWYAPSFTCSLSVRFFPLSRICWPAGVMV